jgi:hypothetical protein
LASGTAKARVDLEIKPYTHLLESFTVYDVVVNIIPAAAIVVVDTLRAAVGGNNDIVGDGCG